MFLFGSRARGEAGSDGDYDLLVVVPDDSDAERATSRLGYQALRGTGVAAEVVVWRRSSFERRAHLRASLPYAALHEGVVFMAVDPVRAEETVAWLARADEDLRAARVLIDAREPLLETAIFHCQQAAEKA